MDKDTLNLVLKANWYELIKAGIKNEEYREITKSLIITETRAIL